MPINLRAAREVADRKAIRQALPRTDNNISGAAKLLGISRPTLYDLLNNIICKYHGLAERLAATQLDTTDARITP